MKLLQVPHRFSSDPLGKLNLPEVIAGPAGKAISRLIARIADIPAAWLEGLAQSIQDRTAARSAVHEAVAKAAANIAATDDELVKRAVQNLVAKEYRRQENKEAVVCRAINVLRDTPEEDPVTTPQDVDDDWLNVFERYAEDASSERLQELWARVLAGQIRKPGRFSLPTLRFIAELDADTAQLFEKWAPSVLDAQVIPYLLRPDDDFSDFLRLEEADLISFSSGMLSRTMTCAAGHLAFRYKKNAVGLTITDNTTLQFPIAPLTKIGREIYSIVTCDDNIDDARIFAEKLPKSNIARIVYGLYVLPTRSILSPVDLWVKQSDTPQTSSSQIAPQ